ncbi:MAG: hypothetical protein JOZ07_02975 [Solirubrobacterales bacterium]|nr:hypothetical protein [Solirubrobacterales bacterium]
MAGNEPTELERRLSEFREHAQRCDGDRLSDSGEALLEQGTQESAAGRNERALEAFEAIVVGLAGLDDPRFQRLVVHALIRKGIALNRLGRLEEAIATNERVIGLGTPAVEGLAEVAAGLELKSGLISRQQLAWVMIARAAAIGQLHRRRETLEAATEIIDRFKDETDPFICSMASMAQSLREEALG